MAFVIPKWTAHGVQDWAGLLVDTPEGGRDINAVTAMLLNYMPVIGVIELRHDNVDDTWRRIAIYQALIGSLLSRAADNQPVFFTRSDIERHIGVETEGKALTFEEFCSDIGKTKLKAKEDTLPAFIANGRMTCLQAAGVGRIVNERGA